MTSIRILGAALLWSAATSSFAASIGSGANSPLVFCIAVHESDARPQFYKEGPRLRACQMALRGCHKWAEANGQEIAGCKVQESGPVDAR